MYMKRTVGWLSFCVSMVWSTSVANGKPVDWSASERISDGMELVRLSYDSPRLMKAHAVRVDLSDKSLFFTANGRDKRWGRPMPYYTNLTIRTRRVTVEEFMMNARAPKALGGGGLDMLLAFNTALWTPCPEPIPTPYAQTHGLNISDGVVVSSVHTNFVKGLFVLWKNGGVDILPTPLDPARIPDAWIAHSGWDVVLRDGKPLFRPSSGDVHPRTALGLSKDRRWLYVLAVEGRHKGVSIGAGYSDLADIMLLLGASDAVNMDGGGSTALVRWDETAQRQVTCLTQDVPPRRDALCIGICRRHTVGDAPPQLDADRLYEAAIDADIGRSASLFHHYEFNDVADTPPPHGYRPFYISHFGRHGSRFQRSENELNACVVMNEAEKAGVLTDPGKVLQKRLRPLYDAHQGMYESLSILGAEEHRRLAQRMHDRFPDVFLGGGRVRCQSSTFHRCLSSMANFTCSLKGVEPKLDFAFETGERCMSRISPPLYGSGERGLKVVDEKRKAEVEAALLRRFVEPNRLMSLLFRNGPAAQKLVGDPHVFVQNLFLAASTFQPLERELGGLDIYDFFTREERLALARYLDCRYYVGMGNSEEFGNRNLRSARCLLTDIIERAGEALKDGGVCADLRFGHDSALMPLLCHLRVDGLGRRVPAAEAWKICPHWKYMPMAANLQIVFYRNKTGDCLVKILVNEREVKLAGTLPHIGPYYRWRDLKNYLAQ